MRNIHIFFCCKQTHYHAIYPSFIKYLQIWLLSELWRLGISEIIVGKCRVQCWYQVEQGLPVDSITENWRAGASLILGARATRVRECPAAAVRRCWEGIAAVPVGGRRESLNCAGATTSGELFVLLFLGANHFAGIALNPNTKQFI